MRQALIDRCPFIPDLSNYLIAFVIQPFCYSIDLTEPGSNYLFLTHQ